MYPGNLKAVALAITLAMASLALAACGSDGGEADTPTKPPVPATTANRLASLSDEVAADLEDGETCTAAGEADDLLAAVQDADLPASISSGVESAAQSLVNEVNCPPPPEPEPKKPKEEKHGEDKKGKEEHGGEPTTTTGHVPPGQAKGQD
jgi:hypothetical protein